MNRIKTTLIRSKNYVKTHKSTIAVGAVAVASSAMVVRNQREFNKFLDEKGLTEEFYATEEN